MDNQADNNPEGGAMDNQVVDDPEDDHVVDNLVEKDLHHQAVKGQLWFQDDQACNRAPEHDDQVGNDHRQEAAAKVVKAERGE